MAQLMWQKTWHLPKMTQKGERWWLVGHTIFSLLYSKGRCLICLHCLGICEYFWKKVEKVSEIGKMFIVFHSSIRKDVLDKKWFLSDFSKIHVESSASNKFSTEFELSNFVELEPHIHYSSLLLFSIQFF